jgi:N-acetylmuramoyl-L-alanine amidase
MKVYIEAGHGGRDSGAVGIGGRLEREDCQKITDIIVNLLKQSNVTTIVNTNPDESLSEVVNQANRENVDVFISIHRNAFNDPNANGLEVWTCLNAREKTKANAKIMYEKLMCITSEMTGRGIKENNFYVLKYTNAPAMLLELGFITNQHDNELFDKYISEYATAITKGICEIFGIQKNYTVQIGTYNDRSKAEAICKDARIKGFWETTIIE